MKLLWAKALIVAVLVAGIASGCGKHLGAVPLTVGPDGVSIGAVRLSSAAKSNGRFQAGVDPSGKTPDGAYQIRTLHAQGVILRHVSSYITPEGTYTQQEYSTPYGALTIVQASLSRPASPGPSVSVAAVSGIAVDLIASGTSKHGYAWTLIGGIRPHSNHLSVTFPDSQIAADIPDAISAVTVQSVVSEVY